MNKLKNLLGLSYKAKKLIIGSDNIEKNIDKVKLIVVSDSLSMETLKKINHIGELKIDCIITTTELLSESLGLNNVKAVGVIDMGFKELIINSL